MATPAYNGSGQPLADNGSGWLGRLGSFFGNGGTPTYTGDGQPSSSGGFLGGATPAYASAPRATQPESSNENEQQAMVTGPIDPEALAQGQIAIVIPRERLGP